MQLHTVKIVGFKRFTDLTIENIPPSARLIVLVGPNGCGKSSLLEALNAWGRNRPHGTVTRNQEDYYIKDEDEFKFDHVGNAVALQFYDDPETLSKRLVYLRSAYRNDAAFRANQLNRSPSIFKRPGVQKIINNDETVSLNYERLVTSSIEDLWHIGEKTTTFEEYRTSKIAEIQTSLQSLFGDLLFEGPGHPFEDGTFLFTKGTVNKFVYENLSAGEKAAFDLILDLAIVRDAYDNTLYCIDEPEAHMHTNLQGKLLTVLRDLIPPNSQLILATHSIGMIRRASELATQNPDTDTVVFIDFADRDFDQPVCLSPAVPDRLFWKQAYIYTLDDLATLIAPKHIIICEGQPEGEARINRHDVDANCYDTVFRDGYPDVMFVSGGGVEEVSNDQRSITKILNRALPGVKVTKFIDHDDLGTEEEEVLLRSGVRVQPYRNLETWLYDDEVLRALAQQQDKSDALPELLEKKRALLEESKKSNAPDNLKPISGPLYEECKRLLGVGRRGNSTQTFMQYVLAPVVHRNMTVYQRVKEALFGQTEGDRE